jgi:hypothetical protein
MVQISEIKTMAPQYYEEKWLESVGRKAFPKTQRDDPQGVSNG